MDTTTCKSKNMSLSVMVVQSEGGCTLNYWEDYRRTVLEILKEKHPSPTKPDPTELFCSLCLITTIDRWWHHCFTCWTCSPQNQRNTVKCNYQHDERINLRIRINWLVSLTSIQKWIPSSFWILGTKHKYPVLQMHSIIVLNHANHHASLGTTINTYCTSTCNTHILDFWFLITEKKKDQKPVTHIIKWTCSIYSWRYRTLPSLHVYQWLDSITDTLVSNDN